MNTQNSFLQSFFHKNKALKIAILAVLGLIVLFGVVGGINLYLFTQEAMETPGRLAIVEVGDGDSLSKVAARLEDAKVIKSALKFKVLARLKKESGRLQAGVFEFSTGWTPLQVLEHLVHGKPTLERVTIREGLPWWSVGKVLEEGGFVKKEEFDKAVENEELLKELGIPFKNAEGFLYPDTYFLKKPATPEDGDAKKLVSLMVNTFWKKASGVWGDKRPGESDLKRLIILSSLVEKETGVPSERATVAGVYANRLRIGMALQCDPTVIYGMGEGFGSNLKRKHLNDEDNLYNTYKHAGLPPGPICSPGLAALEAAVSPATHDYLYFVATGLGDGKHNFNKTLQAHNKDVAKYLAERRKQRSAQRITVDDSSNGTMGKVGASSGAGDMPVAMGGGVTVTLPVVVEETLGTNSTSPTFSLEGSGRGRQQLNSTAANAAMPPSFNATPKATQRGPLNTTGGSTLNAASKKTANASQPLVVPANAASSKNSSSARAFTNETKVAPGTDSGPVVNGPIKKGIVNSTGNGTSKETSVGTGSAGTGSAGTGSAGTGKAQNIESATPSPSPSSSQSPSSAHSPSSPLAPSRSAPSAPSPISPANAPLPAQNATNATLSSPNKAKGTGVYNKKEGGNQVNSKAGGQASKRVSSRVSKRASNKASPKNSKSKKKLKKKHVEN